MSAPSSASSDHRYRTGLIVCGVLEIFAGLLLGMSALFLALTALGGGGLPGLETAGDAGSAPGTLVMASFLYAGVSLLLLSLGVGSILPRRWVRPLVLYVASLWLLAGLLLLVVVAGAFVAIGAMAVPTEPGAESPLGMLAAPALYALLGLIIFAIYVVLPGALLLFHRRRGLKEALERLDPVTRWTDGCPTPVLSLSLSLAISAALCLPFLRGPLPIFGWTLRGAAAAVVTAITAAALALLAIATYRRSSLGWWGSLVAIVAMTILSVDLAFRLDLTRLAADLTVAPAAPPGAGAAAPSPDTAAWLLGAGSLLFGAVCLVALLRLRPHFRTSA